MRPAGSGFDGARSRDPQLRQKFMPAELGVWQAGQISPPAAPPDGCGTAGGGPSPGNPARGTGVEPAAAANREPQLRQKIEPEGLSRPHDEQRGMVARR
jgi:hypothetical protein